MNRPESKDPQQARRQERDEVLSGSPSTGEMRCNLKTGVLQTCVVNGKERTATLVCETVMLLPTQCPHRGGPLVEAEIVGPWV